MFSVPLVLSHTRTLREMRFGMLFAYPGFHPVVLRLHQSHYPASRSRQVVWSCVVIGIVAALLAVAPWWFDEPSGGVDYDS